MFSKDELGDYINEELANDSVKKNIDSEIQIFQNALDFSNVKAREVMVPRAEIVSADRYSNSDSLKKIFIETGLSKILIHRATYITSSLPRWLYFSYASRRRI